VLVSRLTFLTRQAQPLKL